VKALNLKTYSKTKRQANQGLLATEVPYANMDVLITLAILHKSEGSVHPNLCCLNPKIIRQLELKDMKVIGKGIPKLTIHFLSCLRTMDASEFIPMVEWLGLFSYNRNKIRRSGK